MTSRKTILSLLLLLAPCSLPLAPLMAQESSDDFSVWSEIGIEKDINKKWSFGLDFEYRAQDKARYSIGLGTNYKLFKGLKLGMSYSFLYAKKLDKYKDKSEGEVGSGEWTIGFNHTPSYWYPRHRFCVEATGSIKLWRWLKISLRERYQLTYRRADCIDKFKYRETHLMQYSLPESVGYLEDEDGFPVLDENGDLIPVDENGNPTDGQMIVTESVTPPTYATEPKFITTETDQVLRSRIKLEFDKKRCPFSPFISAEFHNSVSKGDHMLLQKIRTAIGTSYKFLKHHEISLAYMTTFDMFEKEENETTLMLETVRLHDRMHTVNIGYKYSF